VTSARGLAPGDRSALRKGLAVGLLALGLASPVFAAVKPGLEGAQDLFKRNHWEEARAHLRAQWNALPQTDRAAASFLIGRSYVREAELYRAVRQVGVEVGLAYLKELAGQRSSRGIALIPLFTAFYQLEAGDDAGAARGLQAAAALPSLPAEWKASAQLRHTVALRRLGRAGATEALLAQPSLEARFWRLLAKGTVDASPLVAANSRERLLAAALEFRGNRAVAAEQRLAGIDLDQPAAESRPDPKKLLRFHDPLVATAWERICWERAVIALRPQAIGGSGVEQTLAAYYTGLSLFELGAYDEAARFLKQASVPTLPATLSARARLLLAACSWPTRVPSAGELLQLWESTQTQPDTVLTWDELARAPLARSEPFASKLEVREQALLASSPERPSGALVGGWALARLRRGAEPAALVATLAEYRDDSNKNKIDWNDPMLLLALAAANHRNQQYAQSLETLFELAKSFPGLRWLQWNLQGVYAARQKAGGETRISQ
jgi:hypothetical protein